MSVSIETDICGIPLENPFIVASASPAATIELIEKSFIAGWAGVITKTIKPDDMDIEDARPRFNVIKEGKKIIGFENFELVSKNNIGYWINGIKYLKEKYPSKVIIASIMGDEEEESWKALAITMEIAGADGIELNFSCPHGMPEKGVGASVGQDPEITEKITAWVKGVVDIPVIVKLTPNVTDIDYIASAATRGGADGFAAINTVQSLSGINLETFEPQPSVNGMSTYGGLSGRAIKPIGLRIVSQVAISQKLPIMGIGGISDWKDAMEYMAVGACSVQICTEIMISGFDIVKDLIIKTEEYLKKMGFSSIKEVIGKALPMLTSHENLIKNSPIVAKVDEDTCIGCGLCVTACNDGGYTAVEMHKKKAVILLDKCDGCSLCVHVCPVSAITLETIDTHEAVAV